MSAGRVLHPDDTHYFLYPAQAAHDVGEVQAVIHFQREVQGGVLALMGETDVPDVGICSRDRGGDLCQHPALIDSQQLDADIEGAVDVLVPHHIQPLLVAAASTAQVLAVVGVHDQPLPALDHTDDRIARDRPAALRALGRHTFSDLYG